MPIKILWSLVPVGKWGSQLQQLV